MIVISNRIPNEKTTSYKVAVGGVVSALCLALMFMTGIAPLLSMAIPIYAGALMIIVSREINTKQALAAYCAVSILSLFLTPDKEAATLFIIYFGYYPIILPKLNQIKLSIIRVFVKLLLFNMMMILWYKLMIFIMGSYDFIEEFAFFGKYALLIVMIIINLIFALYDYTIKAIDDYYVRYFRQKYLGKKPIKKDKDKE